MLNAYSPSNLIGVEFLLKHLEGQARRKVLSQPPADRSTPSKVLQHLTVAFGDQRPVAQLLTAFHGRRQQASETVVEFGHALQNLASRISVRDKVSISDSTLRDRFCEGLEDANLRRELRRVIRANPEVRIQELRQEALRWVREEGTPCEVAHSYLQVAEPLEPPQARIRASAEMAEGNAMDTLLAEVVKQLAAMQTTQAAILAV